jgi:hypothetical protein
MEYTYDPNGNRTLYMYFVWDKTSSEWAYYDKSEYTYDESSRKVQDLMSDWDESGSQWVYDLKRKYYYHQQSAGLPDGSTSPNFVIHPNPASDYIRLDIVNSSSEGLLLFIYDLQGRAVLKQFVEAAHQLYLGDLGNGIYTCVVISGTERLTGKLMILNE